MSDHPTEIAALHPLELALSSAICRLASLKAPRLSPFASPDEIMAVSDFLNGIVEAIDPLVFATGQEFVACAPGGHGIRKELAHFQDQLRIALDGEAFHALSVAAEIAEQEYSDAAE